MIATSLALAILATKPVPLDIGRLLAIRVADVSPLGDEDLCFAGDGSTTRFESPFDKLVALRVSRRISRIVRIGVRAAPFLIEHLSDRTPTQIALPFEPIFIDDYYDSTTPNSAITKRRPPEWPKSMPTGHCVTVGDLCYFLLGQIVNRDFDSLAPFAGLTGNSFNGPSVTPSLATQAKAEWSGLTRSRLKQSLTNDLLHPLVAWRDVGATRRLMAYFPGSYIGELAVRRLKTSSANIEHIDDAIIFYAPTRRHAVLRYPNKLIPVQATTLLLALADLRSARLDAYLAERLQATGDETSVAADDEFLLAAIRRLHRYRRRTYYGLCDACCRRRAKTSAFRGAFLRELTPQDLTLPRNAHHQ